MTGLAEVKTPALVLDLDRLERNVAAMAHKATRLGVRLRPHIKTHKCLEIARRQVAAGASGLTVSTLGEARAFAAAGFDDITWAFPVIPGRIDEVLALAERVRLRLVVDTLPAVQLLESTRRPLEVFLKVDCGYHRAGVDPTSDHAVQVAGNLAASQTLDFVGILTHAGHAYARSGTRALLEVAHQEREVMVRFAERLRSERIGVREISVGSTPTMSVIDDLTGVDEIRPGNYVFYDRSQVAYGSCTAADCALTVLSSIVSCQPGTSHSVCDAGALTLSKDPGPGGEGAASYGEIFGDYSRGDLLPDLRLTSLSQEHGIVSRPFPVGSRLRILPNHSCLTAAQFDHYQVARGERIVDRWPITRGPSAGQSR